MSITQPTSNQQTSEGGARLNKLLSRQLRKHLDGNIPETGPLRDFILAVNDSYNHFAHDRSLLERSMDMSFSELKESNQKLVESEAMFYDMALDVPGMIYQFILRLDGSMSFLYVSPGSVELVGLSPEVIVQDSYSIINMVAETDRQTLRDSLLQAGNSQGPWNWIGKVRLASGRTRWIKGRSRPKKLPNGTILWNGLLVDITESKQNEVKLQLFRNLIDQSNDAIFVTDAATGKFSDVNEWACTTLGEKIETTVHVESPVTYIGDKSRLRIIFNNLISNAIRYHNVWQPNPYIRTEVVVSAEKVRIRVEDNGQGISQQRIDKIFNMFYRANTSTKGSGLGLYIVKETLLKLQGSVVVHSVPRQGTSFTLDIPNLQNPNTKKYSRLPLE